ncbi:MAG TPA: hypothetical protein VN580_11955 [Clostridia bacterium]|jgi:hypothetical protein|nr:hypothetical protein [Clostridia bacterium]
MPLIYFEVFCAKCGKGLCKLTTVDERSGLKVEVQPCPKCLKDAEDEGFDKGFLSAYQDTREYAEK